MLKATDMAIAMNDGRYLVGMTDLHGNYDILAALRDPQTLCMDLLDCPELVEPAAKAVTAAFDESFRQCYRQVASAGMGSTCWTNFWHGAGICSQLRFLVHGFAGNRPGNDLAAHCGGNG